jgi:FKBP-type peptidyl-prolyl cis-trans isomerase
MKWVLVCGGVVVLGISFSAFAQEGEEEAAGGVGKGGRQNITLGAMFYEEFQQQEGVQELKSGILYKIQATGKGKTPKTSDWVKVNYEGKHVDGNGFDKMESYRTRVDRTVPGWQEVLPRMREGDKWEIVIPSHLAYGAKGMKGKGDKSIGANETLVFLIELVEVEDPAKKAEVKQP